VSTVVFLHAHPDDEALFTGGTIAKLSAAGVRVILITATDGGAGLVSDEVAATHDIAALREAELARSCRILGVAQRFSLGFADSGLDGHAEAGGRTRFADCDPADVGVGVNEILQLVHADVLVGYDAAGGYGHPDHVQVHQVVRSVIANSDRLTGLEATLPREPLLRLVSNIRKLHPLVPSLSGLDLKTWQHAFTAREDIAFTVNVGRFWQQKRAALAAHSSQASGDQGPRTIDALLKLPRPVFRKLMGTEFYGTVPDSSLKTFQTDTLSHIFEKNRSGKKRRRS
jgi:LmbE family N-acetylglucosaminyl deacetylase